MIETLWNAEYEDAKEDNKTVYQPPAQTQSKRGASANWNGVAAIFGVGRNTETLFADFGNGLRITVLNPHGAPSRRPPPLPPPAHPPLHLGSLKTVEQYLPTIMHLTFDASDTISIWSGEVTGRIQR